MAEIYQQDEYGTLYVAPVTLRQVEAAGVRLDSAFGISAEEHAELLDDPGILRLVFGAEYTEGVEVGETVRIECLSARVGKGAEWGECFYWERHGYTEGAIRQANGRNLAALERLLDSAVPEARGLIAEARKPLDEWAASLDEQE